MSMLPDIVPIVTHVRLATKQDLLQAPGLLKFGQPFYLYSHKNKRFEGVYVMNVNHSSKEIQAWFNANMVYVPINVLENPIRQLPEEYLTSKLESA
ncbi:MULTISPECIES: hypothetical protein [Flavobacteriaceae]|uniref:hypothetical protein n=1 Tax=Flavobacteriaceae TaxID=49546 RepID=UPI003A947B18